ncbi:MAG TPA: hypothetical protein VE088_06435 [Gaiellaceae bacterium]|jgi:hypothetical protein|nr:hypothetical protein [Gaiellaceae bacterium]
MVARVARFEGVDAEEAQRTMAEAEAVIRPLVEGLPGYRGQLQLLAADGDFLSIALFDSDEHAAAAEPTFDEEMPRRLGDLFRGWRGSRVSVGRYAVVMDDLARGGGFAAVPGEEA